DDMFGDDQLLQFDEFIMDKPDDEGADDSGQDLQPPLQEEQYPPVFDEANAAEESQAAPSVYNTMPPPRAVSVKPLSRAMSCNPAPSLASRVSMSSPRLAPAPFP